ncbi:MAG: AAA family ATPase [Candidatus Omnitrophota bacterium]
MNLLEKKRAAYHEAGHIVVTYLCAPNKDISKTTLSSPESQTGLTWITDKEKTYSRDKFTLIAEIKVLLAGYATEKMKFGNSSDNVEKEFERATTIAHNMTWRWGMGRSGYVGSFDSSDWRGLYGVTPQELNRDSQDIFDSALNEIKDTLRRNWKIVETFAEKLIEKSELNSSEIETVFNQAGINRPTIEELLNLSETKKGETTTGWKDVIGMEEVKTEAAEIVKLIKDRAAVKKVGGKILRGLLMLGPPGCGKTYLATAMANEAGVPFLAKAGSEFVEMYVGVGASRIRRMFMEAKELAQEKGGCIIFIDEIDAVGAKRSVDISGGQTERNTTLNQLLVEMDGLKDKDYDLNIIVVGATNMNPDFLDSALLRPGRFDRIIVMQSPSLDEREELFRYYLKNIKYDANDIKIDRLARMAVGSSPADIANMIREAALIAVRNNKEQVTMKEINEARERIELGLKRKMRYSQREKELVAYHETGHAVVTYLAVPFQDVFKVTITPRGHTGGVTWTPEKEEIFIRDKNHLLGTIKSFLGSYAAEKIKYGITSSGVWGDFQAATHTAYQMSWSLGMGKSGHVGDFRSEIFKNRFLPSFYNDLDNDADIILKDCLSEAEELLRKNWDIVDEMVKRLIEKEELDYDEIEEIFKKYGKSRP